jgi:cytidine deaminase
MGRSAQMSAAIDRLVMAAKLAAKNAYAPYSGFHVGAALQLDTGQIITGSNFENASYGLSLCAETVAVAKASSEGLMSNITAIAVAGGPAELDMSADIGSKPITPCGRCRQVIKEVADLTQNDIPVHCAHKKGYVTYRLSELLPHAFGPASLE